MTGPGVWGELSKLDAAVYAAIARMPTPGLDQALGRLSRAADFSKLWLGSASALAAFGGEQGHAASGFAFATGVASEAPLAGGLLTALAALVAYSRVHTGVHYPSDVVAGAVIGAALSPIAVAAAERYRAAAP